MRAHEAHLQTFVSGLFALLQACTCSSSDMPDEARKILAKANALHAAERYEEAEPLLRKALEVFEEKYGSKSVAVALMLNNIGQVVDEQGRWPEAYDLYSRAADIMRDVAPDLSDLGSPEQLLAAAILSHRAHVKLILVSNTYNIVRKPDASASLEPATDFSEPEAWARESLAIRERLLEHDALDVAKGLSTLSRILLAKGDVGGAEALVRRELAICSKRLGIGDRITQDAASRLGEIVSIRAPNSAAD
jgi:tetratricopeptide (TPR) repeat protein